MTMTPISPEIVGLEILEDTPMTPEEQARLVQCEAKIKAKLGSKMEADLAIGEALLTIQREKLYRGSEGGRTWEEYLKEESKRLTPDGRSLGSETARYLKGFYYFRQEVLYPPGSCREDRNLPLPTAAAQVRPLLALLDHLRRDPDQINTAQGSPTHADRRSAEAVAIEIWKAACSEAGKDKVPTFEMVNRARLASEAAEFARLRGSSSTRPPLPSRPEAAPQRPAVATPPTEPFTPPTSTAPRPEPTIPAWELEKDEGSMDAGEECRTIWRAINDARKAINRLRGALYHKVATHGSQYLDILRQVDAGAYSLADIDGQIGQICDDMEFIEKLLATESEPGELARSTVDVPAVPAQ